MKKLRIIPAGLMLLSVSAAAGCNSNPPLMTFWVNASNEVTDYLMTQVVPRFKEKYGLAPEDDISILNQGGYDNLYDAVTKAIPANSTPTMAVAYPDHAATYLASDSIIDIEQYFLNNPATAFTEEEKGIEDFVTAFVDEGRDLGGREGLWTMPLYKSTEVMIYNREVMLRYVSEDPVNRRIPETWDELIAFGEWVYKDDPEWWSKEENWPIIWDSDSNLFITHAYQMDIPYTDPSLPEPFVFNNEENKAFVRELKDLHDRDIFATKGSNAGTYSSAYFTKGQAVVAIGSSGGASYNITSNFQVGIAPAPVFNTERKAYIQQGPDVVFFRRSTAEELDWAWKFYKFLTETNYNFQICANISYNPVRYSSYALPMYDEYVGSYAEFVDEALLTDEDGQLVHQNDNGMGLMEMTAYVARDVISNDQLFYSPAFLGSAEARGDETSGVGGVIAGTLTYEGDDIDAQIDRLMVAAYNSAMQAQAGQ